MSCAGAAALWLCFLTMVWFLCPLTLPRVHRWLWGSCSPACSQDFSFGRLSPQEYFLFFPVCLHVVVALPFLNPPYGISRWLVVLRCFWSLSGLAEMACWYSLSSTNHLLIFFYAIFILTLPLTACQKCLYSCISSVCGSGTTKSPITRLMDISWPY